jgi:polar amino acid transport system substrate-binding protein
VKRLSLPILTAVIILTFALASCAPQAPASPTSLPKVRIGTDATFPPFETVDEATKELVGFDVDLMKAVAEKAGLDVEFVNIGFDPLLAGVAECQYDGAIAAITITGDRLEKMLFTDPYINAGQIVSINRATKDVAGKDDLKGKTIGAQIGTTGAMEAKVIPDAELKTYDSYDLAFLDLMNGQIDAVIADYPTALGFVGQNTEKLQVVGDVFTDESYGIAVCKTKTDLVTKLNAGLKAVKEAGTIDQLAQKWLAGQAQ